jgi:hypothetical protein
MLLDNQATYDEADIGPVMDFVERNLREDQLPTTTTGIWLAQQLNFIKAQTYDRLLPGINADRLVPDDTSVPEWVETITIRMFDAVGMAKVIANYADDLPRADVTGAGKTVQVKTLGNSYGYNVNELRASRATGIGLDTRKADAARRAMDLKIASIKLKGDPDFGLYGLFTHPNVPEYVFPNPGDWSTLTGAQIYANLVGMVSAYITQNLGVHTADHLELSTKAYVAATTQFVTGPGGLPISALGLFLSNYPGLTVENIWECTGAGQGANAGKDVALLYERNINNLAHEYVMPFSQLPPDARNLEIVVDCLARSAGVTVYYPLALLKGYTT